MSSRRPNLLSYVSFSSPQPRRQSHPVLPFQNGGEQDPYEKPGRLASGRLYGRPSSPPYATANSKQKWRTPGSRARYLKSGGVVAFVVFVLYLLAPSYRVSRVPVGGESPLFPGQEASDPAAATSKCSKSHDPSKPLIQYALMIDAGSTGSRIHVYRFNNCGPSPELEDEVFEQTAPREGGSGLSSYDADAEGAARSLDVLLDVAVRTVPESYRSCSPVAVKATAGLRKLGPDKSEEILKAVRRRLETAYPFPVLSEERGGVQVMDGKDEGVYAWITTNYLMGKIGGPDKSPTAAVFDLGGGSTQIVFEPTFPQAPRGGMPEKLQEGDHKYELTFGGRDFTLYQHSYLGYGLMSARENLHQVVVLGAHENARSDDRSWLSQPLENPCIQPGQYKTVEVELPASHPLGPSVKVNMTGPATAAPAQCRRLAEQTLKKDEECKLTPCAFNGVHQPALSKTFAREEIFLFSYFYDRTHLLGMPESFSLNELKDLTAKVCQGETGWGVFRGLDGALHELRDRPEYCLDLNFMLALLSTGYEMPMDREVRIAKKIAGKELGWCLGASLPLLSQESGWTCRIKEVS